MDQAEYDNLLRRLTALMMKLDRTYEELVESNRQQRAWHEQQQAFNQAQVAINQRLETLITRMIRQEPNGQDA